MYLLHFNKINSEHLVFSVARRAQTSFERKNIGETEKFR